ncbi:hypothetical protein TEA_020465 [Camellia sinensis var. sinensis]|uniref:Aminoacyl-tRNA synthetase class Ia domain-containing protein n=1 Tax=Camellia sinensis var. sinensis TaxID=542762 RepID=A0A4S4D3Z3_CAMSN|nr:hypothetical protein TEA_020465 [Camellia sinensis var. sinensis]
MGLESGGSGGATGLRRMEAISLSRRHFIRRARKSKYEAINRGKARRRDIQACSDLPKTAFGMRASSAIREPEIQKLWDENQMFKRVSDRNNGSWDHDARKELTPLKLRAKAAKFAKATIKTHMASFKQFGRWGDWDHPYLTLDLDYDAAQYPEGHVPKSICATFRLVSAPPTSGSLLGEFCPICPWPLGLLLLGLFQPILASCCLFPSSTPLVARNLLPRMARNIFVKPTLLTHGGGGFPSFRLRGVSVSDERSFRLSDRSDVHVGDELNGRRLHRRG